MPRTIRIALLLCDTPLPLVQRELNYPTYTPVFLSHLQDTLESYPDKKAVEGVQLEVDSFDVVGKQEYPDESKVREGWYDAVMMTGSAHSAYSPLPWLHRLISYIHTLSTDPSYSHLKIIGICFGMQVIAMAVGGPQAVVPNEKGWEIGVYEVGLTDAGRDWFGRVMAGAVDVGRSRMQQDGRTSVEHTEDVERMSERVVEKVVGTEKIHIQQMHRDHLPQVPPNFELLGSSPKCKVQGIVQYYPEDSSTEETKGSRDGNGRRKIRIVGLQGHPEFTTAIVDRMISVRSESGVLDPPTAEEARRRSSAQSGGEGRGVIGWGIWAVLLEL